MTGVMSKYTYLFNLELNCEAGFKCVPCFTVTVVFILKKTRNSSGFKHHKHKKKFVFRLFLDSGCGYFPTLNAWILSQNEYKN